MADLSILLENYLKEGPGLIGDINNDEIVNLNDYAYFGRLWMLNCYCHN